MLSAGRDFDADLAKVVKLNNDVDHVKDIVWSEAEIILRPAEAWLHIVKNP